MTELIHPETGEVGVYMCIDILDRPVYIGMTADLKRRLREHETKSHWWRHVVRTEWYPQADRELALFVERNAIRRLRPEFNTQSNVDPLAPAESILHMLLRACVSGATA